MTCSLQKFSDIPNQTKFGKLAFAIFLAGLVLLVSTIGASAALHEAIHPDANTPGHSCAITLFTKGQVSAATVEPLILGAFFCAGVLVLLPETFFLPQANYRFSSSRAPPVRF